MAESPKSKDQAQADQRRDELAKRVLKMPPAPKEKRPDRSGTPHSNEESKNGRDAD